MYSIRSLCFKISVLKLLVAGPSLRVSTDILKRREQILCSTIATRYYGFDEKFPKGTALL